MHVCPFAETKLMKLSNKWKCLDWRFTCAMHRATCSASVCGPMLCTNVERVGRREPACTLWVPMRHGRVGPWHQPGQEAVRTPQHCHDVLKPSVDTALRRVVRYSRATAAVHAATVSSAYAIGWHCGRSCKRRRGSASTDANVRLLPCGIPACMVIVLCLPYLAVISVVVGPCSFSR